MADPAARPYSTSSRTNGDPNYTLAQVSINDLILVFAFAPIAGFLLPTMAATHSCSAQLSIAAHLRPTHNRSPQRSGPRRIAGVMQW